MGRARPRPALREWSGAMLTVGVLAAAAWVAVPERSAASETASAASSLGSLVGRDTVVRLTHSAHGPLYTITTSDGTVLYERLSVEDLRLHFPDLDPHVLHADLAGSARTDPVGAGLP